MRSLFIVLAVGLTFGCTHARATEEHFKLINLVDLDKLLAGPKPVHLFDANGKKTRETEGVIPGAALLTSAGDYDLGVLPKDRQATLVFYCHSPK